jgi:hypothetical protein
VTFLPDKTKPILQPTVSQHADPEGRCTLWPVTSDSLRCCWKGQSCTLAPCFFGDSLHDCLFPTLHGNRLFLKDYQESRRDTISTSFLILHEHDYIKRSLNAIRRSLPMASRACENRETEEHDFYCITCRRRRSSRAAALYSGDCRKCRRRRFMASSGVGEFRSPLVVNVVHFHHFRWPSSDREHIISKTGMQSCVLPPELPAMGGDDMSDNLPPAVRFTTKPEAWLQGDKSNKVDRE